MITRTLKADRAIAAAWASYAPVTGTRYDVALGSKSVTITADDNDAMRRAVSALAGPLLFEVIAPAGKIHAQYTCPFCSSTLTIAECDGNDAAGWSVAELTIRAAGVRASHEFSNAERCGVPL